MESLKEYNLEYLIKKLTPIINSIKQKKGNINRDFWLKMVMNLSIKPEIGWIVREEASGETIS